MQYSFPKRSKLVTVLLVLFIAIILFLPVPTLVMRQQGGNSGFVIPLVLDQSFTLEYVHSVQKTPVQEHFVLAPGNQLLLTSTEYQSYGVGLPFLPGEGKLEIGDGVLVLSGLNRSFSKINIGFMPLAKQALLYRGNRLAFDDYFEPGKVLELEVENYSAVEIIYQAWLLRGR